MVVVDHVKVSRALSHTVTHRRRSMSIQTIPELDGLSFVVATGSGLFPAVFYWSEA